MAQEAEKMKSVDVLEEARAEALATPDMVPVSWISPKGRTINMLLEPMSLEESRRMQKAQETYQLQAQAYSRLYEEAARERKACKAQPPSPPNTVEEMLDIIVQHTYHAETKKRLFEAADKEALKASGMPAGSLYRTLQAAFVRMNRVTDEEVAAAKDFSNATQRSSS